VLSLIILIALIASALNGKEQAIVADDQGISVMRTRGRGRFIPWHDIKVFLHPIVRADTLPTGGYFLWGREHGLFISIPNPKVQAECTGLLAVPEQDNDTFLVDANRLLATIAARSSTPLRVYTGARKLLGWVQRHAPVITIDLDDALAAPVVSAPLQPSEPAIAAVTFASSVVLKQRRSILPAVLESLVWIAGLLVFGVIFVRTDSYLMEAMGGAYVPVLVGGVLFLAGLGVAFAIARRADASQAVIADSFGIKGRVFATASQTKRRYVPWVDMRAWVVIPANPQGRQPTRYILVAKGPATGEMPAGTTIKVYWNEPYGRQLAGRRVKGDRGAAYREQAEQRHALIAARTGLPLREYGSDAPASVSSLEGFSSR
jgi:hypothetical protein